MRVILHATGETMKGEPSATLAAASADLATGLVASFFDKAVGLWIYVPDGLVDHYRQNLAVDVVTIWVES